MTTLPMSYDYRLVVLSVVIAILSSYAALDLAGRVAANRGFARDMWLVGGALAMGSGIWAMHYTGMLACRLPVPVRYHLATVLVSFATAILSSLIALRIVGGEKASINRFVVGSVLMGSGVATMHYTGMAAMRIAAATHYNYELVALSVVLAIGISLAGLLLIFFFREESRKLRTKLGIASLVGLAIPVMHYTGMAAVSFTSAPDNPDFSSSIDISHLASSAIVVAIMVVLGCVVFTSLVDRRLSVQQSILENERIMLRALIDNIPDLMYVKDLDGRFILVNQHTASVAGLENPEQLIGKTEFDLFPADIAERWHEGEQTVLASGQPLHDHEEVTRDSDGNMVHILTTKVPLRDGSGKVTGLAGVGRNISARKRIEEALREAHKEAEVFINSVPSVLIGVDSQSRITRWNPTAAGTFGLSSADVVGKELALSGVKWLQPEMGAEVQKWCLEGIARRCDLIPFELDGKTRFAGLTFTPVRDGEYLLIGSDVTDRNALEEQLRQAQKLESIGQLAAGIAHEINTPTQYIGDNVRFLKDAFQDLNPTLQQLQRLASEGKAPVPEDLQTLVDQTAKFDTAYLAEEIPKAIDQTLDGVERVATLVKAMKEFSHPGSKEKSPQDLNQAIQSTITISRNEWKYVADVETKCDDSLPLVPCHLGELNQVFLNIIVNAAHSISDVVAAAGGGKGKITIQTINQEEYAEIRIQDTGTGIPEKVRARIFDPFFTTKRVGKGTGQGLAIARSVVVDKHGGTIHFETCDGEGATFIIRIPKMAAKLAERKAVAV